MNQDNMQLNSTQSKQFLSPEEIAQKIVATGIGKAGLPFAKLLMLGFLAGAYISFAGIGAAMGSVNLLADTNTMGLAKALSGIIFSSGLIMVILSGAELFTGNCLMLASALNRKIRPRLLLRNWGIAYLGNLAGALLIAMLFCASGIPAGGNGLVGGMLIKTAAAKVGLKFHQAIILGLLCNWLVCLAVWMSTAAKDITGKILAVFFPVCLFVTSGYEHSIANMFSIPAGILAKSIPACVDASYAAGVSASQIGELTWVSFIGSNLFPVTLGNVMGGGIFVSAAYWFCYIRKND